MKRINFVGALSFVAAFVLTVAAESNTARSDAYTDAEASWAYVWELQGRGWNDEPDASRADLAISHFTALLESQEYSPRDIASLRFTRAVAAYIANQIRLRDGESVDVSQTMKALEDFDFVIAYRESSSSDVDQQDFANAAYYAGHTASHLLDDQILAGEYWGQCANQLHAGCMNIVAQGYFTGEFGLEPDIEQSIEWHEKVFDTGTFYDCAGGFSALELAWLKTFLPQHESRFDWQTWLEKAIAMHESLIGDRYGPSPCYLASEYVDAYVLELTNGTNNEEWLRRAVRLDESTLYRAIAEYFLGSGSYAAVEEALRAQGDSFHRCVGLLQLIVRAHALNLDTEVSEHIDKLNGLSREQCAVQIAWLTYIGLESDTP